MFRLHPTLSNYLISPTVDDVIQPRLMAAELQSHVGMLLENLIQRLYRARVNPTVYMADAPAPAEIDQPLGSLDKVTLKVYPLDTLVLYLSVAKDYILCANGFRVSFRSEE